MKIKRKFFNWNHYYQNQYFMNKQWMPPTHTCTNVTQTYMRIVPPELLFLSDVCIEGGRRRFFWANRRAKLMNHSLSQMFLLQLLKMFLRKLKNLKRLQCIYNSWYFIFCQKIWCYCGSWPKRFLLFFFFFFTVRWH